MIGLFIYPRFKETIKIKALYIKNIYKRYNKASFENKN